MYLYKCFYEVSEFSTQIVEGKLCLVLKEEEKIFWNQGVLLTSESLEAKLIQKINPY